MAAADFKSEIPNLKSEISNPAAPGFFDRHHFLLRRLHSLTGIVPVGAFLINHLLANSTAFLGPAHFDHHVQLIHNLPWLLGIEVVFIFLPLAFHGGYGVLIAWQGRLNQGRYPYADNWRYTLQRVTAWIMVVFILVHLAHFRLAHWFGGQYYGAAHPAFFEFTRTGFLNMWIPTWAWLLIYVVGLLATVFHFCNGIVTFCITWGITVGVESRKKMSVAAGALGLVLMVWGVLSLYALGRATPRASDLHGMQVSAQTVDAAPGGMRSAGRGSNEPQTSVRAAPRRPRARGFFERSRANDG